MRVECDKIESVPIRDFGHLMTETSATGGVPERRFWRGQLEGELLVPTVFRSPLLAQREVRMTLDFRQVSPARMSEHPRDDEHVKWLVLMRHNTLPARLLDWSESPLVAAFFALDRRDGADEKDAVIWRLDALRLNDYQARERVLHNISSIRVREFAELAFGRRPAQFRNLAGVAAMAPYHFSPQHMAQQSCFTIHRDGKPMEQRRGSEKFLKKFVVPAKLKREFRARLEATGMGRHCLFPDPTNLATVLRERHGNSA